MSTEKFINGKFISQHCVIFYQKAITEIVFNLKLIAP